MSTPSSIQQFDDDRAAGYDDRIRRIAPSYDVLHEALAGLMGAALDSEARLLVVGAGTGAEIAAMGRNRPGWRFTAVDPSPEMLDQCRRRLSGTDLEGRVDYVPEPVEDLSLPETFDGATAVFVSHFLHERAAKRRFFASIADQLSLGAPFAFADLHGAPSPEAHEHMWAAWRTWVAQSSDVEDVEGTFSRIEEEISFVREEKLASVLVDADFASPVQFFQCLLWGAWWTHRTGT